MRDNPAINNSIVSALAPEDRAPATYTTEVVDHADASGTAFHIAASTFGTDATLDAKLQYSDDGTNWTDEPDEKAHNSVAIDQLTATGEAIIQVAMPRGRYSRVELTVGTANVLFAVTSVTGPLRYVAAE